MLPAMMVRLTAVELTAGVRKLPLSSRAGLKRG